MFTRALTKMKTLRRFGRARRGSAAVEFALVLMPFFLLTFGLAEVAMMGFAQTSLDFAVSETARQIRTGRAQMNGVSEGEIRAQLCDELNAFIVMGCDGNLFLDVDRFNSFVDASDGVQGVVLAGSPKIFSAGLDVPYLLSLGDDRRAVLEDVLWTLLNHREFLFAY